MEKATGAKSLHKNSSPTHIRMPSEFLRLAAGVTCKCYLQKHKYLNMNRDI